MEAEKMYSTTKIKPIKKFLKIGATLSGGYNQQSNVIAIYQKNNIYPTNRQ